MSDRDLLLEPTPPAAQPPPAGRSDAPAPPTKLCLLVLFNHRFEANLPKLDWIYGPRFEHLRYLMPFYRGDRPDVIATHYSSFQFQGFFREAWSRLKPEGFTHFLVVADDMVLNPALNGQNVLKALSLGPDSGYVRHARPFGDMSLNWFPTGSALVAVEGKNGVNWQQELPAPAVAAANLAAKGFPMRRLGLQTFKGGARTKGFFQFMFYAVMRLLRRRQDPATDLLALPYPLLASNADLMVIPAAYMDKFTFYSSVFAAMGLFVEIAAPTALALACPHLTGEADTGWAADDYFAGHPDRQAYDAWCRQKGYRLDNLLASFGERTLNLHPIKLTQWSLPDPAS